MPEIVDLEVMKMNMLRKLKSKKLETFDVRVEKVLQNAEKIDIKDSLEGEKLYGISRVSKILSFEFSNGAKLVIHLMLHGNFCWKDVKKKDKNVVAEMQFETGDTVQVKDWSAWMKIELDQKEKNIVSKLLNADYGLDPLSEDFTLKKFEEIMSQKSRSGIKSILMDQKEIAGIGNAYADESLFDAKIHPKAKAKSILESGRAGKLHDSIVKVIKSSIEIVEDLSGGVDISEQERDFMKVYRKSGQKCPNCGYMISCMKVNGRDTFVCEKCQKM
ncbi:hypothetical protein JW710_02665 [Candidatus Dojkabacteria bacterium]|nr:hypothetical protein [Candidatus Dojkabacteria bacterium]